MLFRNLNRIITVFFVFVFSFGYGQNRVGGDVDSYQRLNKKYIIQENFEDNRHNWMGFSQEIVAGQSGLEDQGRYIMTSSPGKSIFIVNQATIQQEDQFEFAITFKFLNPANAESSPLSVSWGVSFETNAQYAFSITPNGKLAFRMLTQDEEKKYLYEDVASIVAPFEKNQVRIVKLNKQYHFYLNDHLVNKSPFESLFGNGLIITSGSNLSVELSRFSLATLEKPESTLNTPPSVSVESPVLIDSQPFETTEKELMIEGIVTDEDGIMSVTINSLEARVIKQNFSMGVPLVKGRNLIKLIVTDNSGIQTVRHYEVIRSEPVENFVAGQKRLAVVIGNGAYQNAPKLRNPVNDAVDMSLALKALGFEVWEYHDLTYNELIQAVRRYGDAINDYNVTMFFYAGHGMQVDEQNYLLPVDAVCDEKRDVQFEAVEVQKILKLMVAFDQESLHMLVLDACRNNPFRTWSRGGESGLASMQPPSGTLIAYATSPGASASDGAGDNGLYTNELIKQLRKSQRIEDVFINTRVEVEKKSYGQQSPWELARLRGKYYLK